MLLSRTVFPQKFSGKWSRSKQCPLVSCVRQFVSEGGDHTAECRTTGSVHGQHFKTQHFTCLCEGGASTCDFM